MRRFPKKIPGFVWTSCLSQKGKFIAYFISLKVYFDYFPLNKCPLRKYIENFTSENRKFSNKNSDIFHISAKNIDCGEAVLTSTHNLCF